MAAGIDTDTLQRLIDLGKRKGQLSTEDLFAGLPVDSMSAEDIAMVVLEIEEAGVPVEPDDTLLTRSCQAEMRPMAEPAPLLPSLPQPADPRKPVDHTATAHVATAPAELSATAAADDRESPRINRVVALAGVLTLLILGGGVLLLGR